MRLRHLFATATPREARRLELVLWRRVRRFPFPRPLPAPPPRRRKRRPQRITLAITRTQRDTGNNVNNLSAYDTNSISPGGNKLILTLVRGHHTTAGTPTLTVTANAGLTLTFSQVVTVAWNTIASPTEGLYIHGAISGASPGTGTVHLAFSGTGATQSGCIWEILEIDGADLSGGTVASVVQQTGTGSSDTAGTTLTDTFGSAPNTNNAVFACAGQAVKTGGIYTWNNGFTEGIDTGSGENTAYNLTTGFVLSGFTSTTHTVTSTSSTVWGICGCELKVAAAAAPGAPEPRVFLQAVSRGATF